MHLQSDTKRTSAPQLF